MRNRAQFFLLLSSSLIALTGFLWPFLFRADQNLISGYLAIGMVALAAFGLLFALDAQPIAPKQLALIGALAALAAATRIATGGVAGFELVFLFVILGGAALGARNGFLIGVLTILTSSLFYGGIGPWTPFQVFAVGWVGLGAGWVFCVAKQSRFALAILAMYGFIASYLFGALMNLWFWPFATVGSTLQYNPDADFSTNAASFLLYTLTTSTLSWDSVRAIVIIIGILLLGKSVLAILSRAKL